jgi:uncharacterized protein (DUF362 family)
MAQGISVKFTSYKETVPRVLKLIKLDQELMKHNKIVLKPFLRNSDSDYTSPEFVEAVLNFCIEHKKPETEIFIAEGSDGEDTVSLFDSKGYKALAEKYSVGLIDLNNTEIQEIQDGEFIKYGPIYYPKILTDSFIISLPKLFEDEELEITGSLSNMIGAYPSTYYKGFFSRTKSKIRKHPIKYAIHDITKCKMPNLALIDASDKGLIIVGKPLAADKQAAKALGRDWKAISHIKLIDESIVEEIVSAKKESVQKDSSKAQ